MSQQSSIQQSQVKLSIVIHTEEEFDWAGNFNRNNTSVTHVKELSAMCTTMLDLGCCITFAIDWAFINSVQGPSLINSLKNKYPKQIEFAAHLHPWINPPFDEQSSINENIDEALSYPGNLPLEIEKAKLSLLTQKIEGLTKVKPTSYLAGRYGVGKNTYKILKDLGYKVDVSISPFTNFNHQNGPDFSQYDNRTLVKDGIKCIPHSCGYISHINSLSDWLNKDAKNLHRLNNTLPGKALLKLCGVNKIRLSPEGFQYYDMQKLADSLKRIGIQHLIYSFHSSSSKLKGSPYALTLADKNKLVEQNKLALSNFSKHFQCALLTECVDFSDNE